MFFVSFDNIGNEYKMSREITNKKCQAILAAAKNLFWKHGVKRVSVREICKEAGASKMSFYRFFDNKLDLAKTLLDQVFNEGMAEYDAIMQRDISFAEKVQQSLLLKHKNSQSISQELIMDLYKNQELGLMQYLEAQSETMMERVLDDYEQAQREGHIRTGIQRGFIKYQLLKMRQMMVDPQLVGLYENPHDLIMELTNFLFYGLLSRDNKS